MNKTDWNKRFIDLAKYIGEWSKDRSTKVGAIIVDPNKVVILMGYNGFPREFDDDCNSYHERPAKYKWTEHAERNAIYNAARQGISVVGCTMYVCLFPCIDCSRGIVQSGISTLVTYKPDFNNSNWGESFKDSFYLLNKCNVKIKYI